MEYKDINRIFEIDWGNRISFEAICLEFSISEAEVIALIRKELKASNSRLWRKRVHSGMSQKHAHKRNPKNINRYSLPNQNNSFLNLLKKTYYKEHPLNSNYTGYEESRDWISDSLTGYFPSFFNYWKKIEKPIHLKHNKYDH